jgi:hypothetical protein
MTIVADVPARPDGLELIGEMVGSGYRTPPSLVRRQDGQTLQVTPLLYAVLEAVDGPAHMRTSPGSWARGPAGPSRHPTSRRSWSVSFGPSDCSSRPTAPRHGWSDRTP